MFAHNEDFLSVRILGCGRRQIIKESKLIFGDHNFRLDKIRYRPIFLLKYLAQGELNFSSHSQSFGQSRYGVFHLLRKIFGIAIYKKTLFKGFFSGFEVEVRVDVTKANAAPRLHIPSSKVWISRFSGRHGLILESYEDEIEYNIRRFLHSYELIVLRVDILPSKYSRNSLLRSARKTFDKRVSDCLRNTNQNQVDNFLSNLPNWHYAQTYLALGLNKTNQNVFPYIDSESFLNKYLTDQSLIKSSIERQKHKNAKELTESPVFKSVNVKNVWVFNGKNLIVDGMRVATGREDIPSTGKWPSNCWTLPNSSYCGIPNILKSEGELENAIYLVGNSNWHHFIEEVVAPLLLNDGRKSKDFLLVGGSSDLMQDNLIQKLTSAQIKRLSSFSKYFVSNFTFFINLNTRNLTAEGIPDALSTDSELMKKFVVEIANSHKAMDSKKSDIFILRDRGLFRPLCNQNRLRLLLEKRGFREIHLESTSLDERIEIFSSAQSVVLETGAAQANLYFTNRAKILEIRHPDMRNTREHIPIREATNADYEYIIGKKNRSIIRMFTKKDSWRVDLCDVEEWIDAKALQ